MNCTLVDLHQDRDQLWRWHVANSGNDRIIVSRQHWTSRVEAERALQQFLDMLKRLAIL